MIRVESAGDEEEEEKTNRKAQHAKLIVLTRKTKGHAFREKLQANCEKISGEEEKSLPMQPNENIIAIDCHALLTVILFVSILNDQIFDHSFSIYTDALVAAFLF